MKETGGLVDPDADARRRLEDVRHAVLTSPDLPMPREERARVAEYELRVAPPGQDAVSLEVDVVRGGLDADGKSAGTVRKEVELTPQIVAESPDGLRVFVAWNHVTRTFVVWLTPEAERAVAGGDEDLDEATARSLPLVDEQNPPLSGEME